MRTCMMLMNCDCGQDVDLPACRFLVTLPDASEALYMTTDHSNGTYSAVFTPTQAGSYSVIMYCGNALAASGTYSTLAVASGPPSAATSFVDKAESSLYSRATLSATVQV